MNSYPNPRSVLVLDNAKIHHGENITKLCQDHGVLLVYLPAYSPDLNPIEKAFAAMKRRLQRDQGWLTAQEKGAYLLRTAGQVMIRTLLRPLFESSGYATRHEWHHVDARLSRTIGHI